MSPSREALRRQVSRHLIGQGVEVGPGHAPFELSYDGIDVTFVDRWQPDENRDLFPELGQDAPFPKPDIVANLDTDRLAALPDQSQDFVICSHVLEHLAEPIGFIDEMHRVLRPGGIALILLPDRHRTFDHKRPPTSLEHLVAEHSARVTEVDEDHVREFLVFTDDPSVAGDGAASRRLPFELLEWHRRRSIHVHCWDMGEFVPVLTYGIRVLGERWELVDTLFTEEGGPENFEFGFVLRRSVAELPGELLAERLVSTWRVQAESVAARARELANLHRQLDELSAELDEVHRRVDAAQPGQAKRWRATGDRMSAIGRDAAGGVKQRIESLISARRDRR